MRALRDLGVQMIPAYSPQAQGLRNATSGPGRDGCRRKSGYGISTLAEANRCASTTLAEFNSRFQVPAAQRGALHRLPAPRLLT